MAEEDDWYDVSDEEDALLNRAYDRSETSASSQACENEHGVRERKINFSSSPTPTPLRWGSINSLQFIFYHARSMDFEEKIEGL